MLYVLTHSLSLFLSLFLSISLIIYFSFQTFRDQGLSDYSVCYLRIITSGYLQSNADFYTAFIDGYATVKEYCSTVSIIMIDSSGLPIIFDAFLCPLGG